MKSKNQVNVDVFGGLTAEQVEKDARTFPTYEDVVERHGGKISEDDAGMVAGMVCAGGGC